VPVPMVDPQSKPAGPSRPVRRSSCERAATHVEPAGRLPATLLAKEAKRPTDAAAIASLTYPHIRTVREQQRGRVPCPIANTAHGLQSRHRLACIAPVRTYVGTEGPFLELAALMTTCPSHDLRRVDERERVPCEVDGALHNDPAAPPSAPRSHLVDIERRAEAHLGYISQGNEARLLRPRAAW
jgi:hypothetical protein